jgi:hypothetical protein
MPIIPTVFRPIRANDVQTRPVKAYKRYTVTSGSFSGSGYRVHTGIHDIYTDAIGDSSYNYPTNADGVNQHVAWRWIDHRYYRYPYDPSRSHELTDKRLNEKFLFVSSSTLTVPYFEMGESIKPGSFTVTSSVNGIPIRLEDDGYGNLRDPQIATSSFATSSRCFFYMGFNDEYRQFDDNAGFIASGSVKYELGGTIKNAIAKQITIGPGIEVSGSTGLGSSGICADFISGPIDEGEIRVPHDNLFNRFNSCDRWTISLWVNQVGDNAVFMSKGPVQTEQYFDVGEQRILTRTIQNPSWPTDIQNFPTTDFSNYRTPFIIGSNGDHIYFKCSNGTRDLTLSGSRNDGADNTWRHIAVVRDNDFATLYFNGTAVDSGSMPNESTANNADIQFGTYGFDYASTGIMEGYIDEIRMYDYALANSEIASLANRHYLSASLYQTNVVGNVFYRNGQAVVTSVLPKYNSGSGFFNTTFTASYRGTHTLYENEVLVRVPADQFNYTLNPTATYRPGTDGSNNDCNITTAGAQSNNGPGELYLSPFVSGTVGPYITTIGLYNDKAQLLAVGKLGTAITKRSDVDMNFIIRWDY